MVQRSEAAANLGTTQVPGKPNERQPINVKDVLDKIKFGNSGRKEATGGGEADSKLVHLAQQINEAFPGSQITALNDEFHHKQKDKNGKTIFSKHLVGKALDFKLPEKPSKEKAAEIQERIRDLGASRVLDEYYYPSPRSTGDHFHVEVMKEGGIIQSQPGGTLVKAAEAGMNEAFVPLPNGKSIPVSMPGLDKLTEKISDKLNPEKLLLNVLTKNLPELGKVMTMANIANTAGSSEMTTPEKILEIAKMLNPTVRLISKLYDTYQTVSSDGFSAKPNNTVPNVASDVFSAKPNNTVPDVASDVFSAKPNTTIPDLTSIINARLEQQQTSEQELITKLNTAITSNSSGNTDNSSALNSMVEMLAEKLDSMNNKLETSNSLQDDLLKYSKM
jgi:hypothetical protein